MDTGIIANKSSSGKNKVLFISLLLPYSISSGYGLHFFSFLKVLSSQSDIDLVCFVDDEKELIHIDSLRPYCRSIIPIAKNIRSRKHQIAAFLSLLSSAFRGIPYQVSKCSSGVMRKNIEQLLRDNNYDTVFAVDIGMAQYIKDYKKAPKVLFKTYIESLFFQEFAWLTSNIFFKVWANLEAGKLRRYERITLKDFDRVVTVTNNDADYLRQRISDQLKCTSIPVGIDLDFFSFPRKEPQRRNILLVGSLLWYPNLDQTRWFLQKIFPGIKKQAPDVRLTIVGGGAPADILAYAHQPGMSIVGHSEDIRPYFKDATLMVVPVRICGGGLRTKILTALASSVPVVSTGIACDGLGLINQKHIIVADSEKDFAHAVLRVLGDADLRERLAIEGYNFIKENFSLTKVARQLEDLLASLTKE